MVNFTKPWAINLLNVSLSRNNYKNVIIIITIKRSFKN